MLFYPTTAKLSFIILLDEPRDVPRGITSPTGLGRVEIFFFILPVLESSGVDTKKII